MATNSGIFVRIDGDSTGLVREINKSEKAIKGFDRDSKQLQVTMKGLASAFSVASIGVAGLATGLIALTANAADNAKEITNLSNVAGISATKFQEMAFAAKSVGIEQDKLSDILKDVNDRAGDLLTEGGGEMAEFFKRLGISAEQAANMVRGLSSADTLQLLVDLMQQAGFNAQQMTSGMEMIASDATALLPLLQNNGAAMAEMSKEASDLGAVLSDVELAELAEAADSINKLKASFSALANELAVAIAPAITDFTDSLTANLKAQRELEAQTKSRDAFLAQAAGVNQLEQQIRIANEEIDQLKRNLSFKTGQDFIEANQVLDDKLWLLEGMNTQLSGMKDVLRELSGVAAEGDGILNQFMETAKGFFHEDGEQKEIDPFLAELSLFADEIAEYEGLVNQKNAIDKQMADNAIFEAERERQRVLAIRQSLNAQLITDAKTAMTLLFKDQKDAAYAQTLISGYFSAQKAYEGGLIASGGNVFVAGGYAAASVAATIAQLQGINKTSMDSKGSPSASSGGGAAPSAAAVAPTTQQSYNITLQSDTGYVSTQSVADLFNTINQGLNDGFEFNVQVG